MRRWNGWGDDATTYHLPPGALEFLVARLGPGTPPRDATFADVLAAVPESRLPNHRLISDDPADRVRHARGQSLPDWIAMRYARYAGARYGAFPDGIAYPMSDADARDLLAYARQHGVSLIPYGGGTSVVGGINPRAGETPTLTVDMGRLNRLQRLDETSQLATFGAGVAGPDVEAYLRAYGFTLGHYPQSFEYSTLGGWIATRSTGQELRHYGRIEALFAGGHIETPAGPLDLPPFPASAAGPDLRHSVLGSEGRLGLITRATVRVTPLPPFESVRAIFFPDFAHGRAAARAMVQARLPIAMLRLSTAVETQTTLALAGHERLIGTLEGLLSLRGIKEDKAMLLLGIVGEEAVGRAAEEMALAIAGQQRGVHGGPVGVTFGKQWQASRFTTPYLRNTLWQTGYAIDTLETATHWSNVPALIGAIESALHEAMQTVSGGQERVHIFTHLSHMYPTGTSLYTTLVFRLADAPEETLARWRALKTAASEAIVAQGGTISHQHGVGEDHAAYLEAEKGAVGLDMIRGVIRQLDPDGLMNPGKLCD